MAVDVTHKTGGESSSNNLQTLTTPSTTPVAGALYLLCITAYTTDSAQPGDPTVTGTNGYNVTWTQVDKEDFDTVATSMGTIYLYRGVASSAVAGTVSADFGSGIIDAYQISLEEVTGHDPTTPIPQSVTDQDQVSPENTATLAAMVNSDSRSLMLRAKNSSNATVYTLESGWELLYENGITNPSTHMTVAWSNTAGAVTNPSWTHALGSLETGGILIEIAAAPAGQTENFGIAAETDAALAFTHEKLASYGLASEADAALAFIADRRHLYDIAAETDAGLAFVHSKLAPYGVASETDSALALAASKLVQYGIAAENDVALVFTGELGGGDQTAQYGIASETNTSLAFVSQKLATYGVAAETAAALAFAVAKLAAYGTASEADAALALVAAKLVEYGIATETDEGLAFTASGGQTALYGVAVESDEGLALITSKLAEYGIALEVDRAKRFTLTVQQVIGRYEPATESDRAMPIDSYTARITEAFEVARGDFGYGKNRRPKRYTRGKGRVGR